jgi:L,D-transpeptidase catalytic domain
MRLSSSSPLPQRSDGLVALAIAVSAGFLLLASGSFAQAHTKGRAVTPFSSTLKLGDYSWHPELSPAGAVVVLVNLPDQVLYVYRNGVRIANSTVSSGKAGKTTPTGVFTVLQKKVRHTSTIYKGAQMPHMQRLTWSGIALHAGHLPGYPAIDASFLQDVRGLITPGTTLVLTNMPVNSQTHSGPGFNILTARS